MLRILLTAGFVFSLAAPAVAAGGLEHSYDRSARQQSRIVHGVQSGQVNPRENAWLQRGQARVANIQARAASDGVITNGERAHLRVIQNRQSRHIFRARHNAFGG